MAMTARAFVLRLCGMSEFEMMLQGFDDPYKFRACQSKRRYETLDEAVMAAYHWEKTKGSDLEPYQCKYCQEFHLATRKEKK